jgi:hypothetical protein
MSYLVQKQTSGRVQVLQNSQILADLSEKCTMDIAQNGQGIVVTDLDGYTFNLLLVQVAETQLLPAAIVAFSGDVADLWALLTTSFFIELHANSGGGTVEGNITSVGVNYNILTTDYIIYATANVSVRLPLIGTNIGQVYRIFANGFNVLISCQDPFGDRIMGEVTQNISGFDMVSARAIYTNQWLIAD